MKRTFTKKCGGSRHGIDPLDVYITRRIGAPHTKESRYQVYDTTTGIQHFRKNPVEARALVQSLRDSGHRMRKNPPLVERPYGADHVQVRAIKETTNGSVIEKKHGTSASKMINDLFSGKLHGAKIGIDITLTINGKPIKIK